MDTIRTTWSAPLAHGVSVNTNLEISSDSAYRGMLAKEMRPIVASINDAKVQLKRVVHTYVAMPQRVYENVKAAFDNGLNEAIEAERRASEMMAKALQQYYVLSIADDIRAETVEGQTPLAPEDSTHNVLVKTVPECWKIDGPFKTEYTVSNMAFKFVAEVITKEQDESGKPLPEPDITVSWTLYARMSKEANTSLAINNGMKVDSYEQAEAEIQHFVRRECAQLFTEEYPLIPKKYEKIFSVQGVPFPGHTLESEPGDPIMEATAQISTGRPWVIYSDGNDGEADYYRDVYIFGYVAYSDGECCEVLRKGDDFVTLRNELSELETFTIPRAQYDADFVEHSIGAPCTEKTSSLKEDLCEGAELPGGYIVVQTYAELSDVERAETIDWDETPTAMLAVKKGYLAEIAADGRFKDLEDMLANYTFDTLVGLENAAEDANALAFAYRQGLRQPIKLPKDVPTDALAALAEFLKEIN